MIHIANTPDDACQECAVALTNILKAKIEKSGIAYIAISGGSTPKLLFDIISTSHKEAVDWKRVHVFWVDERCVPPDNSESNYRMTEEHLLKNLPLNTKNIHRVRGEDDAEIEAVRYAAEILSVVPLRTGIPSFDVILLGMGDDGHTASIFPNAMHLIQSNKITSTASHPQSGQVRVTLTGPVINNAEHVMFLATGASKAPVLDIILHNKPEASLYPAAYIAPISGNLDWYVDSEAAKKYSVA